MQYVSSVLWIGRQDGPREGLQQGLQQGLDAERQLLLRQVRRRFEAVADNPPAVEGKPCGDFTCIVKTGDHP